jgi:hypothetical protein
MNRILTAGLGFLLTVAWSGVAAGDEPPGLASNNCGAFWCAG